MRRAALVIAIGFVALIAVPVFSAAPASAHPLGNFTVNHYDGLRVTPTEIVDTAIIDAAEIPTAQLAPSVDRDGDGDATPAERGAYASRRCSALAKGLRLAVDGSTARFAVERSAFSYRPGVAGLPTARLECRLVAPVALEQGGRVTFIDSFEADRIGWREITATTDGLHIEQSAVPERTISDELRNYPNDLLTSPLHVRRATLKVLPGAGGSTSAVDAITVPNSGLAERTIGGLTGKFNAIVGQRHLTVGVGLLAVALALLLGASHALLPGHGKTVMAAYLAGRQGSARDAVLVGATVTGTHTAGVLLLGLALSLSASLAGDAVLGWMGVVSGVLVATLGLGLLTGTIRSGRRHNADHASHDHGAHAHGHHDAPHSHSHGHDHPHHRHGADRPVSRRGLIGMGVAGGLVPSPSALVVLLSAVALGRTVFGVLLVICYGLGMAATLTAAGLLLVRVRDRLQARPGRRSPLAWVSRRWVAALPFATASLVMIVGLGLAARSLNAV